jgi:hypothetical protein
MGLFSFFFGKKSKRNDELFSDSELESFVKKVYIESNGGKPDLKTIREFAKITMERMGLDQEKEKEKPPSYYLEKHKRKHKK